MRTSLFVTAAALTAYLLTGTSNYSAEAVTNAPLCPHSNNLMAHSQFPAVWNVGKSKSHKDGARTCSWKHKGAITYKCDGSDRTGLHLVGKEGKRNQFRPDCDGKSHTISAKLAYSGISGPYHLHWHAGGLLHGDYTNGVLRVAK